MAMKEVLAQVDRADVRTARSDSRGLPKSRPTCAHALVHRCLR